MLMLRLLKIALFLTRVLPDPVVRAGFYPLGTLAYAIRPAPRRTIIANQRQVLGPVSALRLHWQAWRVFVNSLRNYHALLRILTLTDQQLLALVDLRGEEQLEAALSKGRGMIVLGAHMGNYNLLAPYMALYCRLAGAIVEPVQPPELFEFVSAVRARTGLRLLMADREGARGAMRLLRDNGLLAVAGDRYLGTNGTLVPFFGRPTMLPHGAVVLALRTGAPMVPVTLLSRPGGRQLVELRPPLPLVDTGNLRDDLRANMRLVAAAVEETVRAAPHQWVMLDPVWPREERQTVGAEAATALSPGGTPSGGPGAPLHASGVPARSLLVTLSGAALLVAAGSLLRFLAQRRRRRAGR